MDFSIEPLNGCLKCKKILDLMLHLVLYYLEKSTQDY